jgi:hypothetical protein
MVKKSKEYSGEGAVADAAVQTLCNDLPPTAQRQANGRFAAGHTISLKHGARSSRTISRLFAERAAPLREREQQIVADLGGDVSAVTHELIGRFVQTSAVADSLSAHLVHHGVVTSAGRIRPAVNAFLAAVDRLQRLGQTLGLERKARPTEGIREWAERRLREQGGAK